MLAADRFNLDAQLILASSLAGVRRFADAEERLQAALASSPDDPRVYKALSRSSSAGGTRKRPRRRCCAPSSSTRRPRAHESVSGSCISRPDATADGEQQLRAALDVAPDDLDANRTYASYLVTSADCADAEKYWQRVAAKSPDDSGNLRSRTTMSGADGPKTRCVCWRRCRPETRAGRPRCGSRPSSTIAATSRRRRRWSTSCSRRTRPASTDCC